MSNLLTILKEGSFTTSDVDKLIQENRPTVKDVLELQLDELYEIRHPGDVHLASYQSAKTEYISNNSGKSSHNWVYYPWSNTLIHSVGQDLWYELRTNRNRNLISTEEQNKLQSFHVAIAGLSVGSNIASNLIYEGIGSQITIADFDAISPTNLNRMRSKLSQIGEPKIDCTAQHLLELDPYMKINSYRTALDEFSLGDFLGGAGNPPNLVFEIIDDFKMKIKLRQEAKKLRIPVVMITNLGDNVLLDVERYDINPENEIFNGLVQGLDSIVSAKSFSDDRKKQLAAEIVGIENVPKRALDSLRELGSTLAGRPQLMQTCAISAGLATHIAREIALGNKVESSRTLFSLSDIM